MRRTRAEKFSRMFAIIGMSWVSAAISPSFGGDRLIPVVTNGEARAVVVTAETPSPVATLAAEELVQHIQKATGVNLAVVAETDETPDGYTRIYVGATEAAREQGINADELGPDVFVLRTVNNDVYVLGREKADTDPLHSTSSHIRVAANAERSYRGTIFGVYELLERYLGVRWLWPGDLGTFIPSAATLAFDAMDETVAPALRSRRFRFWSVGNALRNYPPKIKRLAFSEEGLHHYSDALHAYFLRHRMGDAEPKPRVGHYFSGWWNRHGNDHPEWFMMREDGGRGAPPNATERQRRDVAVCVTNEELHQYIVEQAWDGGDVLRLGEVDLAVYCHCPECLEWDGPQPEDADRHITSGRYARFWQIIQEMAAERNPDVTVSTFLYMHYFPAPLTDIELNPNIYGEFCPWGGGNTVLYPNDEDRLEWQRAQWRGWADTGITMGYRPNHTLAGYAMPHINIRQSGEFVRFAYDHGMVHADFDSLTGQWAVRGLQHYMYFRLFVDPTQSIDDIREEFFAAFGPAAPYIEAYYDYWEDYGHRLRSEGRWRSMWSDPTSAPDQYPAEAFEPALAMLEHAAIAAERDRDNPEYAARVRFVRTGLEHARLSVAFIDSLGPGASIPEDIPGFKAAREALQELVQFRRDNEHLFFSELVRLSRFENRRIDVDTLLDANIEELNLLDTAGVPWEMPWNVWYYRKDPENAGVEQGWYAAESVDHDHWVEVAVPARLGDTDIGRYLGYGWYFTEFSAPADWKGQDVELLFEGVDEQAWVYLNGRLVGEHTEASEQLTAGELWDRPFTIRIDEAHIRHFYGWDQPSEENVLIVRTHASRGASGIWRPVRIRPAGGN